MRLGIGGMFAEWGKQLSADFYLILYGTSVALSGEKGLTPGMFGNVWGQFWFSQQVGHMVKVAARDADGQSTRHNGELSYPQH